MRAKSTKICPKIRPLSASKKAGGVKLLYKTHKENFSLENCPTRFITKACDSSFEKLSKWIQFYISPLADKLTYKLRDTKQTLRNLARWGKELGQLKEDVFLVSFDINKFYPSVCRKYCHEGLRSILSKYGTGGPSADCILKASELCMDNSVVAYGGNFYRQKDGVPAGLSHVPALTDIASEQLMMKLVKEAKFEVLKDAKGKFCIGLYRDDGLALVKGVNGGDIKKIKEFLDTLAPNLTFEVKVAKKLEFLDIGISLENGYILTKPYSKPTASHKYISPKSCHDRKIIKSIPFSVLYRLRLISSSLDIFKTAAEEYKTYLLDSGYSNQDIDNNIRLVGNLDRENMLVDRKRNKGGHFIAALIVDNHPSLPSIRSGWQKAKIIIQLDDLAGKMLVKPGSIFTAFRRGKNIGEFIGVNRQQGNVERNTGGYSGCGSCNVCE